MHEAGFQVAREPDGERCFRRPDGRVIPQVPPPSAIPDDPVTTLQDANAALGLELGAWTLKTTWLGEGLDVR